MDIVNTSADAKPLRPLPRWGWGIAVLFLLLVVAVQLLPSSSGNVPQRRKNPLVRELEAEARRAQPFAELDGDIRSFLASALTFRENIEKTFMEADAQFSRAWGELETWIRVHEPRSIQQIHRDAKALWAAALDAKTDYRRARLRLDTFKRLDNELTEIRTDLQRALVARGTTAQGAASLRQRFETLKATIEGRAPEDRQSVEQGAEENMNEQVDRLLDCI